MGQLLVSAGINLAVSFALSMLFPPDPQRVEGPRSSTGFSAPGFGGPVNVTFGTDRVSCNPIDTQDPPLEEILTETTEDAGKGKGGTAVTTVTPTYFLTCRLSLGIEGAEALIRLWADGKLVYDATSTGPVLKPGVELIFYPGGAAQLQDPEEVSRRGSDISAYRHLTSIKLNKLPLADFGNHFPNFTAEIAFASSVTNPLLNLTEPPGFRIPSGTEDFLLLNPDRNEVYGLDAGDGSSNGYWSANASTMDFLTQLNGADGFSQPTVGLNGIHYRQKGTTNSQPITGVDLDTGLELFSKGATGISTDDDGVNRWGFQGNWSALQISTAGFGVRTVLCHLNTFVGGSNGTLVDADLLPTHNGGSVQANISLLGTANGFPSQAFVGHSIPDHDRNRLFVFSENGSTSAGTLQLMQVDFTFSLNEVGTVVAAATFSVKREFTKGDAGDDFPTNSVPRGWAVGRADGNLILSTASDLVLYNPDTDTILAKRSGLGFRGRNNYYDGSRLAFFSGSQVHLIDTRDLTTVGSFSLGSINGASVVWDDRTQAVFVSIPTNPADTHVQKIFLNRVAGAGVTLQFVVEKLSTTYNNLRMAGLDISDTDFTALAGETVPGYTLNNAGSFRSALQPLRNRFFFDLFQSDFKMKAAIRGGASVLTIPEQDVGELKRGRGLTDEPPIKELREEDVRLPMRLNVGYRNKDIDYNRDVETDKRQLLPHPTMRSRKDRTLEIPLVDTPTNMKRTAAKWLFALWDERRAYRTVVPWTYIKLDASDVFELVLFGETHTMRLSDQDVGTGLAMDITGIVQDSKSYSSTISAGDNKGFVQQSVPSGLSTRLLPIDAPLLSLQDLLTVALSNAYMGFSAREDGWRGATSHKSTDNVNFTPTAAAGVEVVLGVVNTAPSAWGFVEGDFRNRFQEVADGGTMTIVTLRRDANWSSATELAVLNGANMMGVLRKSDGKVEMLQFVTAAVNADNTVTLSRLLRGRFGTEDVTDLGMVTGDKVVLFTDSAGANALSVPAVQKQTLNVTELNTALFFRGVTIGTALGDALSISNTYAGRDLLPFSVVHTTAVNNAGDVDVDWERRARGPGAAEWLDGTGTVPLNETFQQYEVTITDGVDSLTKTVNDATLVTFTAAELSTASVSGASTVTVAQVGVAGTTFKSPITPSSTATVTV